MRASDPRVVAFDVGLVLFNIAEAVKQRDRAGLLQVQVDLQSIEELIYGKLNEPPIAFVKLLDVLLPLLPDAAEEIEAGAEIEEPDPDPDPAPYHKNALLPLVFGKIDFLSAGERFWAKLSPTQPLESLKTPQNRFLAAF